MVWNERVIVPGGGNDLMPLDLPRLANGIYYLGVQTQDRRWMLKLMVLR
jgi:hypothetical protein